MDFITIIKAAVEIGITPVLLIVFVLYFLKRDKEQVGNFRERENILIAESTRREEILRQEADKREKMIRNEAERRESHLMATIEGFSRTMQKISDAMEDIRGCHMQIETEIAGIKTTIERMRDGSDGGQNRDG